MNSSRLASTFATAGALTVVLGTLALSAFAGPGPQYWTASRTTIAPKNTAGSACSGCKTSVALPYRDRGPAGKSVGGSFFVASKHECDRCTGAILTVNHAIRDTMTRDSAQCSMLTCCK